jgi:hypothetical protein
MPRPSQSSRYYHPQFRNVHHFKIVTAASRISKSLQNRSGATFSAIVVYRELGWIKLCMAGCYQDGNEPGVSEKSSGVLGWLSDS